MPSSLESHVGYTETEWKSVEYFRNVLDYLETKEIKNILDAGGCTGKVTNILVEKIPSIQNAIILEPVEDNYNFTVENTKNISQVKVIQKALFYGETHIHLGQCDNNVGGWSFKHSANKTNKIETITLEDFSDIDFLKMDIEGSETNVIENSISIHNIPYIEVEFHFELLDNWQNYALEKLNNHVIKFDAGIGRANGFFVRKDLIE